MTTKAQRDRILQENERMNGGTLRSDGSGKPLILPKASRKGTVHDPDEAHIDHFDPRANGGSNDNANMQVLGRDENLKKGAKVP